MSEEEVHDRDSRADEPSSAGSSTGEYSTAGAGSTAVNPEPAGVRPVSPGTRPRGGGPPAPPKTAAVVLAGGKADEPFRAAAGVENRALAAVAGLPMAAWVLEALAAAETVDRVVLVGAEGLSETTGVRQHLRGGSDLMDTIERGLGACPGARSVLLVTADIPAVTAAGIDEFVRAGLETGAEFVYPIIPRAANEARFPGVKRTYRRLVDGTFTGGNMVLVRPEALLRQRELVRRVYAARKQPLRLARMLGWGVLWRLLWGRLSVAAAEAAVSRLLGVNSRAIITDHAEIGADVDHVADLTAIESYLRQREANLKEPESKSARQ